MERIRENFLFIFGCNLFSGDCGGQGGGEGGNKDSGGEGSPPHPWLTKTNMAGAGTLGPLAMVPATLAVSTCLSRSCVLCPCICSPTQLANMPNGPNND